MPMKISVMTRVFWECYRWPGRTFNYALNQILKRIASSGYECVDLCEYPLEFWPLDLDEEDAASLKVVTNSLGLEVSGITVPTFSPGLELLPAKEDRMIIEERLKRAIELVSYLGGKTVMYGICPREIYGSTREETYKWTLELFTECTSVAEERDVNIAVEFVNTCFPTTQSIIEFLDKVRSENVGVCLEVGNLNARPREETILEHLERCSNRIRLFHLVNPASAEWLKSIGVDLLEVIGALRDTGYDGHLVVEGWGKPVPCSKLDTEVSRSARYLQEALRVLQSSLPT